MAGNQNSGRRPKPTALKVFEGMRQDRINADEPRPGIGEPARPTLSSGAEAIWTLEAPRLVTLGVLSLADGRAFATFCELSATADLIVAEKGAETFKPLVMKATVDGDGNVHLEARENPLIAMERRTAAALRPYLAMFGLEPSSRSRLKAVQATPHDRLRDFLTRGNRGA